MGEVDNDLRMGWASYALDAFGAQTGQSGYDYSDREHLGEIAGDLMANLLHLARGAGMPPREMFDRAWDHFEDEVFEEEHLRPRLDGTDRPDGTDAQDTPNADRTDRPRDHDEDSLVGHDAASASARSPAPVDSVVYLAQGEDDECLYGFSDEATAASYAELRHNTAVFPVTIQSPASAREIVAQVIRAQEREGPRGVRYRTEADIPPGHDLVAACDLSEGDRILGWFDDGTGAAPDIRGLITGVRGGGDGEDVVMALDDRREYCVWEGKRFVIVVNEPEPDPGAAVTP